MDKKLFEDFWDYFILFYFILFYEQKKIGITYLYINVKVYKW